jgi:hypothetical protein
MELLIVIVLKDDFYLIGMCIAKGYPCAHTSLPLIFGNSS